ncbi:MAG: hypothetical protein MJ252_30720, partial [archaeon]|nr:hypothetical protein [archaeon]
AQSEFTKKLGLNGLRAIIALSNMDGCRDYKDPDYSAGESSRYMPYPKITYKKHRKQVGVNSDDMIGIENRTSNGYKLYQGLFRGATLRNIEQNYIPRDMVVEINAASEALKKLCENENTPVTPYTKFTEFNKTMYNSDFAEGVLTKGLFEGLDSTFSEDVKGWVTNITNTTAKCSNNYVIYCDSSECKYVNSSGGEPFPEEWSSAQTDNPAAVNLFIAYCRYDAYPVAILENTEGKKEVIANNLQMSTALPMVIQGCFGVFHSGGKKDKNACRDTVRDKCGTTLDYHCKKLGFYDYINSNPFSYEMPPACAINNTVCFNWINRHFFVGGVAIRPSALIGTNLLIQRELEAADIMEYPQTYPLPSSGKNLRNLAEGEEEEEEEEGTEEEEEEQPRVSPTCNYCKNDTIYDSFTVLGINKDTETSGNTNYAGEFVLNMNKGNHLILENSSNGLKFKLWNCLFLFVAFLLF